MIAVTLWPMVVQCNRNRNHKITGCADGVSTARVTTGSTLVVMATIVHGRCGWLAHVPARCLLGGCQGVGRRMGAC